MELHLFHLASVSHTECVVREHAGCQGCPGWRKLAFAGVVGQCFVEEVPGQGLAHTRGRVPNRVHQGEEAIRTQLQEWHNRMGRQARLLRLQPALPHWDMVSVGKELLFQPGHQLFLSSGVAEGLGQPACVEN